jgi:hypothetical protein
MNIAMENFTPIKGIERYSINKFGQVKNEKGLIMKTFIGKSKNSPIHKGYHRIALVVDDKRKKFFVHILMAKTFLNYDSYENPIVDHIDNDSFNNNLDNLQVTTKRHNSSKDVVRKVNNLLGVYKRGNTYCSAIKINGKKVYLGTFKTEQEAHEQYMKALNKLNKYTGDDLLFRNSL